MALDKTKVVYQIYPKSYKDTTGNGIGDFRGIFLFFVYCGARADDFQLISAYAL